MQYIDAVYNKVSRLFPALFRFDYLRFGFMPSAGVNIGGWVRRKGVGQMGLVECKV